MDAVEAFERGSVGLFELLPQYFRDTHCVREDGLLILLAGEVSSPFNGVMILDQNALTEARLRDLERLFADRHVPIAFEFNSRRCATSCHNLLTEHGYGLVVSDPIMIREGPLRLPRPLNPAVQIRPLDGPQDHVAYRHIMTEAFRLSEYIVHEQFEAMFRIAGDGHRMAWVDGEPVGCGMLLFANDVATIYNVATLPGAQRQGVGTAMMVALHSRALEAGYGATTLAVQSDEGFALYAELGYRKGGCQLIYAVE